MNKLEKQTMKENLVYEVIQHMGLTNLPNPGSDRLWSLLMSLPMRYLLDQIPREKQIYYMKPALN